MITYLLLHALKCNCVMGKLCVTSPFGKCFSERPAKLNGTRISLLYHYFWLIRNSAVGADFLSWWLPWLHHGCDTYVTILSMCTACCSLFLKDKTVLGAFHIWRKLFILWYMYGKEDIQKTLKVMNVCSNEVGMLIVLRDLKPWTIYFKIHIILNWNQLSITYIYFDSIAIIIPCDLIDTTQWRNVS